MNEELIKNETFTFSNGSKIEISLIGIKNTGEFKVVYKTFCVRYFKIYSNYASALRTYKKLISIYKARPA